MKTSFLVIGLKVLPIDLLDHILSDNTFFAAKTERKLLETYNVGFCRSESIISSSQEDKTSSQILRLFHPAMVGTVMPVSTIGDGNCLYKAIALGLTGSEEQHILLRLLSALELIEHKDYYKSDTFLTDNRIVKNDYDQLLHDVIVLNSFSGIEQFYVVSAVLNQTIKSYYPPQNYPDFTSEPLMRQVIGRQCKDLTPQVTVMWTEMNFNATASVLNPNHFVPLVRKDTLSEETCTDVTPRYGKIILQPYMYVDLIVMVFSAK
jgi:hypothetical protein